MLGLVLTTAFAHHVVPVVGTLDTQIVACAGLCTESAWDGTISGTSTFSLISLTDTGLDNVSEYRGNLVITEDDGHELIGTDDGLWNLETGNFVEELTITQGASGTILLWGVLDPVSGVGSTHYLGVLRLP
ncbi:MAG TPA: hypothetical protein VGM88_13565 [Kofleriaceae bacterium]|jgi:hypothetical protein